MPSIVILLSESFPPAPRKKRRRRSFCSVSLSGEFSAVVEAMKLGDAEGAGRALDAYVRGVLLEVSRETSGGRR